MSIVCYTGLPGDGKSYSAVENFVIPALKQGRIVAHNLSLCVPALNVVCDRDVSPLLVQIPKDATPEKVIELVPGGAVTVLDEIWEYWPAGLKANEVPKDQLAFFKKHRHRVDESGHAQELLIIDQDPATGIPNFLRSLVELTYVHTKLRSVGADKKFRVDVYRRCQSAVKPKQDALIRKLFGSYKPEVWNCYDSHTESKSKMGEAGLEKMPDTRGRIWSSWTMRSAMGAFLLLPFLFWFAWSTFSGMMGGDRASAIPPNRPDPTVRQITQDEIYRAPVLGQPTPVPMPIPAPERPQDASQPVTGVDAIPEPEPGPQLPQMSARWRVLGGALNPGTGRAVVVVASATGRQVMDESACQLDDNLQWRCEMDDGQATPWSGGAFSNLSAARPEGFAPG